MSPWNNHFRYVKRNDMNHLKQFDFLRTTVRMYPAIIHCSTVIYFGEWPQNALMAVAQHLLVKFDRSQTLSELCASIHLSAKKFATRMKNEFRREIHITSTNFIQFVRYYNR